MGPTSRPADADGLMPLVDAVQSVEVDSSKWDDVEYNVCTHGVRLTLQVCLVLGWLGQQLGDNFCRLQGHRLTAVTADSKPAIVAATFRRSCCVLIFRWVAVARSFLPSPKSPESGLRLPKPRRFFGNTAEMSD